MGFTFSYTSSFAFHKDAYFEVDTYDYVKGATPVNTTCSGSIYVDNTAFKEKRAPVGEFIFNFLYDTSLVAKGKSIETQADDNLKLLVTNKAKVGSFTTGSLSDLIESNPEYKQGSSTVSGRRLDGIGRLF